MTARLRLAAGRSHLPTRLAGDVTGVVRRHMATARSGGEPSSEGTGPRPANHSADGSPATTAAAPHVNRPWRAGESARIGRALPLQRTGCGPAVGPDRATKAATD